MGLKPTLPEIQKGRIWKSSNSFIDVLYGLELLSFRTWMSFFPRHLEKYYE